MYMPFEGACTVMKTAAAPDILHGYTVQMSGVIYIMVQVTGAGFVDGVFRKYLHIKKKCIIIQVSACEMSQRQNDADMHAKR